MSELRDELNRIGRPFEPEPGGFERLSSRRRRRRLTRQTGSISLALFLAAGGLLVAVRALGPRDATRPAAASAPITAQNIGRLTLGWTGSTGAEPGAAISVGSGEVLVGSPHDLLTAFPSSCRTRRCGPLWSASGVIAMGGPTSAPVLSRGTAFVASHGLGAFPERCGRDASACAPSWTANARLPVRWMTTPVLANGRLYVGTDDGRLLTFAMTCASADRTCPPVGSTRVGIGGISATPVAAGGDVYVVSDRLYDLPASCAGAGLCAPRWSAPIGPFASQPVAGDGSVYLTNDERLLAFRTSCGNGGATCRPDWTFAAEDRSALSPPAVANGIVYVAGSHLYALPSGCARDGGSCAPLWRSRVAVPASTAPAVANGLVFLSSGGRVVAFADGCRSASATCSPVWVSGRLEPELSAPAIGPSGVFVMGASGTLYAFVVGPSSG
jgi:outer membrane protein assembly factor BamB